MEERAIRGVAWTLFAYGGNKLVTVVTTIVLARLLAPADFGLITMALLAIGAISMVAGLGVAGALVVRQDLDKRGQGTVLTLLIATGVAFSLLLAALSPLAADAFEAPRLTGVLVVLAAVVFFNGINWFHETVMLRELQFRRRFVCMMVQTIAYAAVALTLAALGAGVWSLVAGVVVGSLLYTVTLISLSTYRVAPAFDHAAAREVLAIGRGFLAQGGTTFLQQNIDYFAVGRILGAGQLGFYSMAYRLGELPYWAIADPVAKVTFPVFARMQHRKEKVEPAFLSTLRLVALVTCPVGVLLSATADPFVVVVFGEKWLPAVGPLVVLGIWAAVRPIEVTIGSLLNSLGEPEVVGTVSVLLLIPLAPALLLAAKFADITVVAQVVLAHAVVMVLLLSFVTQRRTGIGAIRHWRMLRPIAFGAVVGWLSARAAVEVMDSSPAYVALAGSAVAGFAAYLAAVWLVDPSLPAYALKQVGRVLGRSTVIGGRT